MPINASGAISLGASASTNRTNSVGSRLFVANGSGLDMNNPTLRSTAEVGGSGTGYSLSNFYNKPSWAYSSYYDCSNFSGWTTSVNYDNSGNARYVTNYANAHWEFRADGNYVPFIWQERRFDLATTFDIQFDFMCNNATAPHMQFQIASQVPVYTTTYFGTIPISNWSNTLGGTGFRYTPSGIDYCSFGSGTDIGSAGGNLITWYTPCNGTTAASGQLRTGLWTRLRFVGYKSGGVWYGTVTATAAYYDGAVLGSANFAFNASGNGVVARTFANEDGGGQRAYVDNVWVTVD